MANFVYGKAKQAFGNKQIDWLNDDIRAILVDGADYTPAQNTDEFLSAITAGAREEVSASFTGKTNVLGALGAANVTFSSTAGDACELVVVYQHTGVDSTARLIACFDTAGGLPVTLGGNVTCAWGGGIVLNL